MSKTAIIDGVEYRQVESASNYHLIRSRDAGVHFGEIVASSDAEGWVRLAPGCRRVWRWRGANTLTELANDGCRSAKDSGYTRVSKPSALGITVIGVCEVIPCTDVAARSIESAGWAE